MKNPSDPQQLSLQMQKKTLKKSSEIRDKRKEKWI
jgi:hypothetical protein